MSAPNNPLLEISTKIPFDRIEVDCVLPGLEALLEETTRAIDSIARSTAEPSFEDTLLALDTATERLETASTVVGHLESVATTPALREAYNTIEPQITELFSSIPLNEDLWHRLSALAASEEVKELDPTARRFLDKTVDSFRRHGAELDAAGKSKLSEIDVALSKLTTRFRQNVLDATNAFELIIDDESRLAGLPPSAVDAAREAAATKDLEGWRFTLQAPSYIPLMTYLDDRALREEVYRAQTTLASCGEVDNRELVKEILRLRQQKAELLGYASFADLVLEDRMAHTGEAAQSFVRDLEARSRSFYEAENRELESFYREQATIVGGTESPDLAAWDIPYWAEKQRRAAFDFDAELLRPYFPLPRVIQGMFELVERLYGIVIEETEDEPTWAPEVRTYRILDGNDGPWLGSFYADFYPRENKRGGAWMNAFITGRRTADGSAATPHVGLICANLTPPVGDRPALLTHSDVETLFHEFGHLLHHCLSEAPIRSQAGTNVAWDFVELPSQIMENWCWEREALNLFARHVDTGKPIPEDLFSKLSTARNYRSANAMMRQLGFASLDLALHLDYEPGRDGDLTAYAREILQRFTPAELAARYSMITSFAHLFGSPVGYGAGYYSYKWAELLDADAFTRFKQEGLFNREVGREFREKILARGDSEDPSVLYRKFMGREPDPEAILIRSGLVDR